MNLTILFVVVVGAISGLVGEKRQAHNVSMNVSWAALVVSALIAIWGFMQLPQ